MGQWAVCILDKSNVFVGKDSGLEGTFNVFIGKEEAEAYLTAHDEWLAQADDTDSERCCHWSGRRGGSRRRRREGGY